MTVTSCVQAREWTQEVSQRPLAQTRIPGTNYLLTGVDTAVRRRAPLTL